MRVLMSRLHSPCTLIDQSVLLASQCVVRPLKIAHRIRGRAKKVSALNASHTERVPILACARFIDRPHGERPLNKSASFGVQLINIRQ